MANDTIQSVSAEQIPDSRGNMTLRVNVRTEHAKGVFEVPSGASTGEHEAHELRGESGSVENAVRLVSEVIAPAVHGLPVNAQARIDEALCALDGTSQKERLGGNSMIGVSVAATRAAAQASKMPLYAYLRTLADIKPSRRAPLLFVNLINGGKHARGGSPFQEHQVIPDTENIDEALAMAASIYEELGKILVGTGKTVSEGDEGGYVCAVEDVTLPFAWLAQAVGNAGYTGRVYIGADIAASSFAADGGYDVLGSVLSAKELGALYVSIQERFGLRFIEDPFDEHAGADFASFRATAGGFVVIGDDLTTTDPVRIRDAAADKSIDAVIIKPNQIGTLTETLSAMKVAREGGIECIVSHRSGETMDDFIADLAYAFGCFGFKAGAPHKAERRVKYKRLSAISHE
ncbi:phosphopyruvate hydratase [Candidatus Kaiserbacteria bacterium]|nr:phosphopyruvate hydratase [Candidatus Kaiserbacteria bacterium]